MSSTAPLCPEPAYRGFPVEVSRVRRLSPSFLRMTFTGPDLADFGDAGLDQRITLVLPAACGAPPDPAAFAGEDWFVAWRARPEGERETLRTYTVRAVRQHLREVDVDVVLHGLAPGAVTTRGCGLADLLGCTCSATVGPAVRWCAAARRGDPLVLVGPNARFDGPPSGIEWRPPAEATRYLLAGDETAVPAICSILESLPAGASGHAFLEVPTAQDVLEVRAPAEVRVHWLPREAAAPHGRALLVAVRRTLRGPSRLGSVQDVATLLAQDPVPAAGAPGGPGAPVAPDGPDAPVWEIPERARAADGLYAWVAGEAGAARDLRRVLLHEVGLDRAAVAVMGYWRTGRAQAA